MIARFRIERQRCRPCHRSHVWSPAWETTCGIMRQTMITEGVRWGQRQGWGGRENGAARSPDRAAPSRSERRPERQAEHAAAIRPAKRERVVEAQHAEEDVDAHPDAVAVERRAV